MSDERGDRCGRCGGDAFARGEPYTFWIWTAGERGLEARALHLCTPCGREFPSQLARSEYLQLTLFG